MWRGNVQASPQCHSLDPFSLPTPQLWWPQGPRPKNVQKHPGGGLVLGPKQHQISLFHSTAIPSCLLWQATRVFSVKHLSENPQLYWKLLGPSPPSIGGSPNSLAWRTKPFIIWPVFKIPSNPRFKLYPPTWNFLNGLPSFTSLVLCLGCVLCLLCSSDLSVTKFLKTQIKEHPLQNIYADPTIWDAFCLMTSKYPCIIPCTSISNHVVIHILFVFLTRL